MKGSLAPRTKLVVGSKSSPSIRDLVLQMIDDANDVVIIGSFLFTSSLIAESLRQASGRGVRVYVMTAATAGLALRKRFVEPLDKEKAKLHRLILREIVGHCRVRSSDHWHAKFVLIDPNSSSPQGCLLSSNLNDGAMLSSPEALVFLRPEEVSYCYQAARREFWSAQFELSDSSALSKPGKEYALTSDDSLATMFNTSGDSNTIIQDIVARIDRCEESLSLSSYQFLPGSPVITAVRNAVTRGVTVRILAHPDDRKLNDQALSTISKVGGDVRMLPWIHAKFCLCDNLTGLFTTQNMEEYASPEIRRFELALDLDPERLRETFLWFNYWWECAENIDDRQV